MCTTKGVGAGANRWAQTVTIWRARILVNVVDVFDSPRHTTNALRVFFSKPYLKRLISYYGKGSTWCLRVNGKILQENKALMLEWRTRTHQIFLAEQVWASATQFVCTTPPSCLVPRAFIILEMPSLGEGPGKEVVLARGALAWGNDSSAAGDMYFIWLRNETRSFPRFPFWKSASE